MPRGRPKKIVNIDAQTNASETKDLLSEVVSIQNSIKSFDSNGDVINLKLDSTVESPAIEKVNEISTLTLDKEKETVTIKDMQPESLIIEDSMIQKNEKVPDPADEFKNIPPKLRKRNQYGLLEGVDYVFKPDGRVNWKAMIKPEFLVFNREKKAEIEKEYNQKLENLTPADIRDEDKDKYCLILLAGIRDLAALRGYMNIYSKVADSSTFKATVETSITWIRNFESDGSGFVATSGIASASTENTVGFGSMFLEAIAENRSFVRAVRNYLEINIVGVDEIKPVGKTSETPANEKFSINSILQNAAEELKLTFPTFKEGLIKYKDILESDYSKWFTYGDVPPSDAYKLVNILKKALEAKKLGK